MLPLHHPRRTARDLTPHPEAARFQKLRAANVSRRRAPAKVPVAMGSLIKKRRKRMRKKKHKKLLKKTRWQRRQQGR